MNKFINTLLVSFSCKFVGSDEFGNKYYESKKKDRAFDRKSRHVIYSGEVEASKIPANWFNWMHYQSDVIPRNRPEHKWEKPHQPNLTGTEHAYYPPGHAMGGAARAKATGDYQSWKPKD
jgi:NADH:ubiquinone oxidoreductase subunit